MELDQSVRPTLAEMIDFAERPRSEIAQVMAMCAGVRPYEFSTMEIRQLAFERITYRFEQQLLVFFLEAKEMDKEKYLDNIISLTRRFSQRNREILGSERFNALFGEAGDSPEGLIDRSMFLTSTDNWQCS